MSDTVQRRESRRQRARVAVVDLHSPEMLETVTDALMVPDASEWARRIRASLEKSVEAILETGRLLVEAKAALPHGQFEKMVEADLGWSPQTVRKFMAIARHPVLSDRAHVRVLPASWGTLAELARLKPEPLEKAIGEGIVRPTMTRKDTTELIYRRPQRAKIEALRAEARAFFESSEEAADAFAMADATEKQFEKAIAEAKAEGDLSSANVVRKLTKPKPSPGNVLRGIAEDTVNLLGHIDALRARAAAALASGDFGKPRRKVPVGDYQAAEILKDLGDDLELASDRVGGHYDDLAQRCGLPTREQA